jgi:hypothetical protein
MNEQDEEAELSQGAGFQDFQPVDSGSRFLNF